MTNTAKVGVTLLLSLALLGAMPARAQWPVPLQPQAASPAQLARQAEDEGDLPRAAEQYLAALRRIQSQPPGWRDPGLRILLPGYARVLVAQSRLAEAETSLQLLRSIGTAPAPRQDGASGMEEALRGLQRAFQFALEGARALNQLVLVDGDLAEQVDAMLAFRMPATDQPAALWAGLRARQGRADEVLALWHGDFQRELAALRGGQPELRLLSGDAAATAAWHMGRALQAVGAHAEAGEALQLALRLHTERLRRLAESSAVPDALQGLFQTQRWLAAAQIQLALQSGVPALQEQALAAIVASKGLALRYAQHRRRLLANLGESTVQRARMQIEALEQGFSQLPRGGSEGIRAWADWTNNYAQALGPALPALSRAGLGQVIAEPQALLAASRAAQAPGEAMIGFVQWQPLPLLQDRPEPTRYLRYTLSGSGGISLKDLGSKKVLDQMVGAWRLAAQARGVNPARQAEAGEALAARLLADLPAEIRAVPRWRVDVDGMLALLPLEALPAPDGRPLLELHAVRYLSGPGQAFAPPPRPGESLGPALVMVDPQYPGPAATPSLPGGQARSIELAALPDTRTEGAAVEQALRRLGLATKLLAGAQATPDALRSASSPVLLHIASHGMLLAPSTELDPASRQRLGLLMPGHLAALALSPGSQGPWFMASDLAALNLSGTRLVVLSACDSGNGSQDVHEGLASLRRAAEEAGAHATLSSLWPVPSAATTRLMSLFYEGLAEGRSHSVALQEAKMRLRREGAPTVAWAGFVLAGADQ